MYAPPLLNILFRVTPNLTNLRLKFFEWRISPRRRASPPLCFLIGEPVPTIARQDIRAETA
jgi:hypothetical protein